MKKSFCLILSFVIIFGCLVGCTKKPADGTTAPSTVPTEAPTTPTEPELSPEEKAAKEKAASLAADAQAIYDSYKECPVYWCGVDSADTLAEGQKAIWVQELPKKAPSNNPNTTMGKIKSIYIYYPCDFDPSTMGDSQLREKGVTRVFGYLGIPDPTAESINGMIYVHGGAGHATAGSVIEMMNHGFAGIGLDTEGCYNFTSTSNFSDSGSAFKDDPIGHISNDNFDTTDAPLQDQWMFWAVGDTILAHMVLRSIENVDTVNLIGVSWGGMISTTTICFDHDFDSCVPIYCTFGEEFNVGYNAQKLADRHVARYLWHNRETLSKSPVPTMILSGNDDLYVSVNCNVLTLESLQEGKIIIKPHFDHSHQHGVSSPETYRCVTNLLGLTEGFIEPERQPTKEDGLNYTLKLDVPSDVKEPEVKLYYMTYAIRKYQNANSLPNWKSVDVPFDAETNTITVSVPEDAYMYFLSFNGKNDAVAAARRLSPYSGHTNYHPAALYSSTSVILLQGDTIQHLYNKK